jgi:hypothetical protein
MNPTPASKRTQVIRHHERGVYDKRQIHAILDEGYVCHVGFAVDGQPYVIPTGYGRCDDVLYLLARDIPVCVTVTLVDGFVLARSAFRHSMNYRSVVILGSARLVDDPEEKLRGLRCLTNHIVPDRWEEVRPPNEKELLSTTVLVLPLDEASAKVRSGPPLDVEEDLAMPVWAGVVPLRVETGQPVPESHVAPETQPPDPRRFRRFL